MQRWTRRDSIAATLAVVAGAGFAIFDARPGFDDTGITAVGLTSPRPSPQFTSGRRPWLWAVATGIWVPSWSFAI